MKLRKETLTELTAGDLASIAGGTVTWGCTMTLMLCLPTADCTQVTTR